MFNVASIKFNNGFRTTQNLSQLNACIGETVNCEIEAYFEKISVLADATTNAGSNTTGLAVNNNIIYDPNLGSFNDYKVGDTIHVLTTDFNIVGWAQVFLNLTIIEKPTNKTIRVNQVLPPLATLDTVTIINVTPIKAIRFNYALTNSTGNYLSLTDNSLQQIIGIIDASAIGVYNLTNNLPTTWQTIESFTVETFGYINPAFPTAFPDGVTQKMVIRFSFIVTPLHIENQLQDLLAGIKPTTFAGGLNFRFELFGYRSINDQNVFINKAYQDNSNIGWFNENFENGVTYYSASNLTIKKGTQLINNLEFGNDIEVKFTISNTNSNPFTSFTQIEFGFNYLPEIASLYTNNSNTLIDNFVLDKRILFSNNTVVNGNNFGTPKQVIKNIKSTVLSASQIEVTAIINFGLQSENTISNGSTKYYQMFCIVENQSLADTQTDKTNLLIQVNEIKDAAIDLNIIVADNLLLQHPFELLTDGIGSALDVFPVDDLVAKTSFSLDYDLYPNDIILINRIKPKVVLRKAGQSDILLDVFNINVSNFPLIGGFIQAINFSQLKPYKVPASIRNTVTCNREQSLDVGNNINWSLNYPFFIRWEHWVNLLTSIFPIDLFDAGQPNNGFNHKWYRYYATGNYDVQYVVDFDFTFNGKPATQQFNFNLLQLNDFNSNTIDFVSQKIETFDANNNLLVNGGNSFLLGYADTKIVATFRAVNPIPLNDFEIVIWIETYETGGVKDIRQISSVYPIDSQSWFKSTDNSNKVVKSVSGNDLIGECLVDFTKLGSLQNGYTIYARIYDKTFSNFVEQKQFMNGVNFEFMDGTPYQFMNQ